MNYIFDYICGKVSTDKSIHICEKINIEKIHYHHILNNCRFVEIRDFQMNDADSTYVVQFHHVSVWN